MSHEAIEHEIQNMPHLEKLLKTTSSFFPDEKTLPDENKPYVLHIASIRASNKGLLGAAYDVSVLREISALRKSLIGLAKSKTLGVPKTGLADSAKYKKYLKFINNSKIPLLDKEQHLIILLFKGLQNIKLNLGKKIKTSVREKESQKDQGVIKRIEQKDIPGVKLFYQPLNDLLNQIAAYIANQHELSIANEKIKKAINKADIPYEIFHGKANKILFILNSLTSLRNIDESEKTLITNFYEEIQNLKNEQHLDSTTKLTKLYLIISRAEIEVIDTLEGKLAIEARKSINHDLKSISKKIDPELEKNLAITFDEQRAQYIALKRLYNYTHKSFWQIKSSQTRLAKANKLMNMTKQLNTTTDIKTFFKTLKAEENKLTEENQNRFFLIRWFKSIRLLVTLRKIRVDIETIAKDNKALKTEIESAFVENSRDKQLPIAN